MRTAIKRRIHNLVSDDRFSEILTGSGWAAGAHIIAMGITVVTGILIVRVYGAEEMGVFAVIVSFLMLVTILTVVGTNMSILRLIPEHLAKHSVSSAFRVYRKTRILVAGVSVIAGGALFFGSSVVAGRVFSKPHLSPVFALAAFFVIFKSLMILNTQAVRGLRLIRTFAFMHLLPPMSALLILTGLTLWFFGPRNPVYAHLASFAVTAVAGALIVDRVFRKRMRRDDVVQDMPIKDILFLSAPMFMTTATTIVFAQAGVILLGIMRTAAEVGYYAVAAKLATMIAFVLTAVNSMAVPKFSELYHSGKIDELFHVARKSAKLVFWTTAPILLALTALGKPILGYMFGEEFQSAYPAMVFLLIGQFVNSIAGATGGFLNMTGDQGTLAKIKLAAVVLTVSLGLLLIPGMGINGAAVAAMCGKIFWNICALAAIKIKHGRTIGYFPFASWVLKRIRS